MFSAPFEFDKQDEGHSAHNPLTWNVITTYYKDRGTYAHKKYNNQQINTSEKSQNRTFSVLTGPFAGTQSNNKELVVTHYTNRVYNPKAYMNEFDWKILNRIVHQKQWQK
jgi:hypothetical protein